MSESVNDERGIVDQPTVVEDDVGRKNRNRERNKEHARKTRIRKKEQLEALKSRVHELEEEGRRLKQQIEACDVASILIGLSSGEGTPKQDENVDYSGVATSGLSPTNFSETLTGGKRKRFLSLDGADPTPPPMELNIKGQVTLVGGANNGKAQMNWKTGVYYDEEGNRQQLSLPELKALRRERNRMHAKMTRDRKKCFVASVKRVISKLEEENHKLYELLEKSQKETIQDEKKEDDSKTGSKRKSEDFSRNVISQGLRESSAALSSISNSRIFTIG